MCSLVGYCVSHSCLTSAILSGVQLILDQNECTKLQPEMIVVGCFFVSPAELTSCILNYVFAPEGGAAQFCVRSQPKNFTLGGAKLRQTNLNAGYCYFSFFMGLLFVSLNISMIFFSEILEMFDFSLI